MIHLRAYKAIEEESSCMKFAYGHRKVLEEVDFGNISTNNYDWVYNPNVFVIEAVDSQTKELLGGIRVQVADGEHPLPVEEALYKQDPRISDLVKELAAKGGTSELCGLWNSRKKAPNVGITRNLVIAGIAICNQLPVTSIFTLVALHTLKIATDLGYREVNTIGNNGKFEYPNRNFTARVLTMNPQTLDNTHPMIQRRILALRKNPFLERDEVINPSLKVKYTHQLGMSRAGGIARAV